MKLPANKKERIQIFVLIGIGVVAVIYAVWQLGVTPYLESKATLLKKLQRKQDDLKKAERELKLAPQLKAEFDALTAQLDKAIAEYVLHPTLGSYLVGVTEKLEAQALACNVKVDEIQEIGIRELPRANKEDNTPIAFKSYAVLFSGKGSYEQIALFIRRLEAANPYVCVGDIRIVGQADSVESHRIQLRIEWPIEAEQPQDKGAGKERGGTP